MIEEINAYFYAIMNVVVEFDEVCKMKKSKEYKISSTLSYVSAVLFYLAAIINIIGGINISIGIVWLCLGSTFLCLGSLYLKKSKENIEKEEK